MINNQDTIAAISTPPGMGGIAVIRISGKEALEIVSGVIKPYRDLKQITPNTIIKSKITNENIILDDVLLSIFKAPHSYTGEDIVEISCHGSQYIANQILELLLGKARLAEPGEFTYRAFLNNKVDLTQAEAVADLIHAQTKYSHQIALHQLSGKLYKRIAGYLKVLQEIRINLELEIDFHEQGLDSLNTDLVRQNIVQLRDDLGLLSATGKEGIILRDGYKVALMGAPNVGKSSIFNAFLKTERAIVTPIPGTTRDYLEEDIALQGYLVKIFDTAGIRVTEDTVERIGIDRSKNVILDCDKILWIEDNIHFSDTDLQLLQDFDADKIIKVLNKADLLTPETIAAYRNKGYFVCNTMTDDGLTEIKDALLQEIRISEQELQSGLLTNTRQITAVKHCIESLNKALISLDNEMGFEFTAFDLSEASHFLEEIIGKITNEDMLTEIFSNFCIGK